MRFAEPVPITFANVDGLPAGTMVSIWSVDPERGEFVVVGEGRVSADEQRIETVSGGIRAADWHAPGPQPPQGTEDCEEEEDCPPDEDNPDDCDTTAGSMVCLGNGSLSVSFALPEYRSLAASRGLEFVYRSDSAYPRPAVSFRVTPGITRLRQTALEYQVRWAGRREAPIVVTVPEEGSEVLRLGALLDAAELESGSYPYALWLTNIWVGRDGTVSRFSDVRAGRVLVDNARESAFGAGWRLRGLYALQVYRERLVRARTPGSGAIIRQQRGFGGTVVPGGGLETVGMVVAGVTLMRPGERPVYYQYDFTEQGFVSPGADFATLSFLPERTGYLYREKDGREWTFDEDGQLQQMQDRNGNLTRYAYDAQGRLVGVTDPVGLVTRLRYRNGYLWQVEDPAGRVSDFARDGHGRLIAVRYPDGSRERYAYDERHLLVARWDEREQRTGYGYDANGHVRQTQLPDGSERVLQDRGQVGLYAPGSGTLESPVRSVRQEAAEVGATNTDARGHARQRKLDEHSAPVLTQDAVGRVTRHVRDADSNAMRTTRPNGSVVRRTFDTQGNVLSKTEAFNGATTRYTYDTYSLLTSRTNPRGHVMRYERDDKGNVIRMTDAAGHVTTYTYDARGLLTAETTPNGLVRAYTYNAQGLVERVVETPPAGSPGAARTTQFAYHATGQVAHVVMPDGIEARLAYDARNRLVSMHDNLGRVQTYTYDAYGNRVSEAVRDAEGVAALRMRAVYDARNRQVEKAYPHVEALESVYRHDLDAESNPVSVTHPNGGVSRAVYDSVNRRVSEAHRLQGVSEYTYDELDRIVSVRAPNGVVTTYTYDLLGRRLSEQSADRGEMRYTYDLADNVASITDARGGDGHLYLRYPGAGESGALSEPSREQGRDGALHL